MKTNPSSKKTSKKLQSAMVFTALYSLLTACGSESGSCCGSHVSTDLRYNDQVSLQEASANVNSEKFPLKASLTPGVASSNLSLVSGLNINFDSETLSQTIQIPDSKLDLLKRKLSLKRNDTQEIFSTIESETEITLYGWSPSANQLAIKDDDGFRILTITEDGMGNPTSVLSTFSGYPHWRTDGGLIGSYDAYDSPKSFTFYSHALVKEKKIVVSQEQIRAYSEGSPALYRITIQKLNSSDIVEQSTNFETQDYPSLGSFCVGEDYKTIYGMDRSIDTETGEIQSAVSECDGSHGSAMTSFDMRYSSTTKDGNAFWSGEIQINVTTEGIDQKSLNTKECNANYMAGEMKITYSLTLTSEYGDTIVQEGSVDWSQSDADCEADHCG